MLYERQHAIASPETEKTNLEKCDKERYEYHNLIVHCALYSAATIYISCESSKDDNVDRRDTQTPDGQGTGDRNPYRVLVELGTLA
jgi:hypothetical protein